MEKKDDYHFKNDKKWNDIKQGLEELKTQLDNLIRLNPYILDRNTPENYNRRFG